MSFAPALSLLALLSGAAAPDSSGDLEAALRAIAAEAGGDVGVAIRHVESGERLSIRGGESFPLASVFKLPVALQVLHRVDRGGLRLDRRVRFTVADLSPGHSLLTEGFPRGGEKTVAELLELMLTEGDNTAADLLIALAGGAKAVTARLSELGIDGIRVDRSEAEIAWDYYGVDPVPPRESWSPPTFRRLAEAVPADRRRRAAERFLADPRDTGSPDAIAGLLVRVQRRDALSSESADRLLDWMRRTNTGPARIKGLLPEGTEVAHRTGLCGDFEGVAACTNDVGVITLPRGAGHLAVAVMIRASRRPIEDRESAIARIARAAYDRFSR